MKDTKHTLFHFSDFEKVKTILLSMGFKASYCNEIVSYSFNYENKGSIPYQYYIPMVSFSDKSLSLISKNESTYGACSIGMNINWGKKNGLNPVLYLEKHSKISRSIWRILNNLKQDGTSLVKLDSAATVLMQSIKNFEDKYDNQPITYYDEREWRFIPEIIDIAKYPKYINFDDYEKLNSLGDKPHINESEYLLKFSINDIDYIILECDKQRILFSEFCKQNQLNLNDKIIII